VDGGVVRKLGAQILQFRLLVVARDGDLATLPGGDALLQGSVVQLTATPRYVVQRPLQRRRGTQLLFVRLVHGEVG
jgi:hypothetical protein